MSFFLVFYGPCVEDVSLLLRVVEQVEAERVGRGEDVVQKMYSSSQVARLNQTLQQSDSIGTKVFQTGKTHRKKIHRRLTSFKSYQ